MAKKNPKQGAGPDTQAEAAFGAWFPPDGNLRFAE